MYLTRIQKRVIWKKKKTTLNWVERMYNTWKLKPIRIYGNLLITWNKKFLLAILTNTLISIFIGLSRVSHHFHNMHHLPHKTNTPCFNYSHYNIWMRLIWKTKSELFQLITYFLLMSCVSFKFDQSRFWMKFMALVSLKKKE